MSGEHGEKSALPLPLSSFPLVAKGVIACTAERSVMNFKNYVPYNSNGPITRWYVDHISPNFVAREFVVGHKWNDPLTIPESLVEKLKEDGIYDELVEMNKSSKLDTSTNELVMLETMGYTRWEEVRECIKDGFDPTSFGEVKTALLRHLKIID